jgi:hypothetical protein
MFGHFFEKYCEVLMDSIKKLAQNIFLRFVPALYTNSFGNAQAFRMD